MVVPDEGSFAMTFAPDGRILALGGYDHQIRRWDLAARRELAPWTGHLGPVTCLAFSPDGTRLASGSLDATALVWQQKPLAPLTTSEQDARSAQELKVLWSDLASAEASQAYRAIWNLAGAAEQAVTLLQARLQPPTNEEGPPARAELPSDPGTAVPPPESLRRLRALEVLERIGTPEAYRLLQALATDAPEPQVAAEARAALGRLDQQRAAAP
jgi:hypothetical protein